VSADVATAYRVRGPSAVSGDPRRLFALSRTLAVTDWKLRFFGSVLGYVWSLLRPLLLFGILYVVFSQFVGVNAGVASYPLLLISGIVLFFTFGEMTGGAVTSIHGSPPATDTFPVKVPLFQCTLVWARAALARAMITNVSKNFFNCFSPKDSKFQRFSWFRWPWPAAWPGSRRRGVYARRIDRCRGTERSRVPCIRPLAGSHHWRCEVSPVHTPRTDRRGEETAGGASRRGGGRRGSLISQQDVSPI